MKKKIAQAIENKALNFYPYAMKMGEGLADSQELAPVAIGSDSGQKAEETPIESV